MVDGAPLLFLRPKTPNQGSLQPAAEARLHLRDWAGSALGADGPRDLEASAVFVAAWMMGGFHLARLWHFLIMWAMLAFVFGHLVMVVLHGWNNFVSMLTGWKKDPEYPTK